MSKTNEYGKSYERLRNSLDRFYPVLEHTGEFTYQDIDHEEVYPGDLRWLETNGGIETLRRETKRWDTGTSTYNVYRWCGDTRRKLKDYWEQTDKLPCGHQVHIYNDPEVGELGCKHCAENNKHPEYSKDFVRERL